MKRLTILLLAALLAILPCAALGETLRVTFFDVGKADAMLIETPAGERVLIDAAKNKEGKKLAERFAQAGVTALDAMIITHYDKDHVGGADQMLEALAIGTVIMPVYDKESKQHTQFIEALAKYPPKESIQLPTGQETVFTLPSGLSLHITAAHESFYGSDEENDFSLAVRMQYGDTKFFFAGDAEAARQRELLEEGNVECDVLKAPYHGRYEKSSPAFLQAASPKIAYIHDDDEDQADSRVIALLEQAGAEVYCAKDDGDVTVVSDGRSVWVE